MSDSLQEDRWCLVADLGGTHARFAFVDRSALAAQAMQAPLEALTTLEAKAYASLADALDHYLAEHAGGRRPQTAVLAVASALRGDQVQFTNNHWSFSRRALQAHLGLQTLEVVNDFAAIAWAVPHLGAADVVALGPVMLGQGDALAPRVVLGPGTGLGLAAVHQRPGAVAVVETEGGHVGFAPRDEREIEILHWLMQRHGRVSWERLLCGEGLVNLYRAGLAASGRADQSVQPREVPARAAAGDADAIEAMDRFSLLLGSYAGDAALAHGAWGGVYLAGGLLQHVLDQRRCALLRQRFEDKGRFSALLAQTPLLQITRPHVGKLGAAAYAFHLLAGDAGRSAR